MEQLIFDIIGTSGAITLVAAYFIMQKEIIAGDSFAYNFLNGLGAVLIMISLTHDFNLTALIMEIAWLIISLYGMFHAIKRRRAEK